MELAIDTMSCTSVRDNARAEVTRRRELQTALAAMKSTAADLGTLQAGRPTDRQGAVRGEDSAGYWKFQVAADDAVRIQLTGLTADLDVDLRDSSYEIVAKPRQRGPAAKEIQVALKARNTYYIRIAPADGKRGSAYALRVARGSASPYSSKELAARLVVGVEPVVHTLPANEKDYWGRFTVTDRSKITAVLNWKDAHADFDMEVSYDSGDGKAIDRGHGMNTTAKVERPLDPGTYLVHVYRTDLSTLAEASFSLVLIGDRPAQPGGRRP
jgi:hypothetical protein